MFLCSIFSLIARIGLTLNTPKKIIKAQRARAIMHLQILVSIFSLQAEAVIRKILNTKSTLDQRYMPALPRVIFQDGILYGRGLLMRKASIWVVGTRRIVRQGW
jgi:hypothetical protein